MSKREQLSSLADTPLIDKRAPARIVGRERKGKPPLPIRPGDKVYRVVVIPESRKRSWHVASAVVWQVSHRQLSLHESWHIGLNGKQRFEPLALGTLFFKTPDEAIAHFIKTKEEEMAAAARCIDEAGRAINWAGTIRRSQKAKR